MADGAPHSPALSLEPGPMADAHSPEGALAESLLGRVPCRGIIQVDAPLGAWRKEGSKMMRLAWPMALMNFLQFAQSVIAVGVAGRLGAQQLSVVILGNSIFNITGYSVLSGLSSAMETLCGQEYGAAGNSHVLDVILQRATMILGVACLPIFALWWYLEPVLILVGQEAELAGLAADYVVYLAPALPAVGLVESIKRYLQSQNIVRPSMWISVVSVLCVPPLQWWFVHILGWGVRGAAYALSITYVFTAAMFVGYVLLAGSAWRPNARSWSGWSPAALSGWGEYMCIALPSAAMLCFEWWAFEIVIFMGGWLPNPDLEVATMGIGFNVIAIAFMLPFGISTAASVRTSNELGARNGPAARLAATVALVAGLGVAGTFTSQLFAFRRGWAKVFTSDPVLVEHCQGMLRMVALCCVFDGLNAVCNGIIRGCGRQQLGGAVISVHYLVGLPLASLFAFSMDMGVVGLWAGLTTATALETLGLAVVVGVTDWDSEVRRAAETVSCTEEGVAARESRAALLRGEHDQAAAALGDEGAELPAPELL